jgi:hypothetical protein
VVGKDVDCQPLKIHVEVWSEIYRGRWGKFQKLGHESAEKHKKAQFPWPQSLDFRIVSIYDCYIFHFMTFFYKHVLNLQSNWLTNNVWIVNYFVLLVRSILEEVDNRIVEGILVLLQPVGQVVGNGSWKIKDLCNIQLYILLILNYHSGNQ